MNKRKCDCGAPTYYGKKEEDGDRCEPCYVGELEAIAKNNEILYSKLSEAMKDIFDASEENHILMKEIVQLKKLIKTLKGLS